MIGAFMAGTRPPAGQHPQQRPQMPQQPPHGAFAPQNGQPPPQGMPPQPPGGMAMPPAMQAQQQHMMPRMQNPMHPPQPTGPRYDLTTPEGWAKLGGQGPNPFAPGGAISQGQGHMGMLGAAQTQQGQQAPQQNMPRPPMMGGAFIR